MGGKLKNNKIGKKSLKKVQKMGKKVKKKWEKKVRKNGKKGPKKIGKKNIQKSYLSTFGHCFFIRFLKGFSIFLSRRSKQISFNFFHISSFNWWPHNFLFLLFYFLLTEKKSFKFFRKKKYIFFSFFIFRCFSASFSAVCLRKSRKYKKYRDGRNDVGAMPSGVLTAPFSRYSTFAFPFTLFLHVSRFFFFE